MKIPLQGTTFNGNGKACKVSLTKTANKLALLVANALRVPCMLPSYILTIETGI
jgi:hypothetical protein